MTKADVAPPSGLLTIAQAAEHLDVKPWDVVRLIESQHLDSIIYVPATSLRAYAQETT